MYFKSLQIGDLFFWRSRVSARIGGSMLLMKKISSTQAEEIELARETRVFSPFDISPYARVESAQHSVHLTGGYARRKRTSSKPASR